MKAPPNSLPFMSFSVSSWIATTIGLTLEEYAILHKLACAAWLRNGRLPNNVPAIARLVGVSTEDMARIYPSIESWFERTPDGAVMMPEIEAERLRATQLRDKRRRNAAALNSKLGRGSAANPTDSDTTDDTETVSNPDTDAVSNSETNSVSPPSRRSSRIPTRTHTHTHTHTHTPPDTHSQEGERGNHSSNPPRKPSQPNGHAPPSATADTPSPAPNLEKARD